jgi:RNA polymerase sigma-70 factor, ECF subfamily
LSTWLHAIVVNSARMHIRKRSRQIYLSLDQPLAEEDGDPLSEQLPHRGPSPETQYREAELRAHAVKLMQYLSAPLRRTFQLRELDGLSLRETANVLGVAEGTVKAQLARARAKMRDRLRKASPARPAVLRPAVRSWHLLSSRSNEGTAPSIGGHERFPASQPEEPDHL